MALIVCPLCVREDDVFLIRALPDGRKEARCDDCDFVFTYGKAAEEPSRSAPKPRPKAKAKASVARPKSPAKASVPSIQFALKQFQTSVQVSADRLEHVFALKQEFLSSVAYTPHPGVESHWRKFAWAFSPAGLDKAVIFDLEQFVHDPIGADQGSTAVFDKAWSVMGEFEGARRIRASVEYLLRGNGPIEDRLTELVDGTYSMSMPGFGEELLTKTLSVAESDRFLPILTYAQKRELAHGVYGLDLPSADVGAWTVGRLAVWTNDLLVELLGDDFHDQHHAAHFLLWAQGR
ncbi:hypothetical protein [Aeromicrobium sp. P5_D10]